MAGTPLSEVYDLFMQQISDYRLTTLLETSEYDFETFLQSWLIFSINEFSVCTQSLVFDGTTRIFTETLTSKNKVTLATLMMKYWLQKLVNDVTQLQLHVTDRDFKVASEAMNLKEKSAYLITIKEQCSQLLNDYAYGNVDWTNWYVQNYSGL
jgi:hypothetical protein